MTNEYNIIRAENMAVRSLEALFARAGWADGWELTDDEVRAAQNPLFYRNSTGAVAAEAKVKKDGQTHTLFCVYNISGTQLKYADNKPRSADVTIALTFYYDDAFLFYDGDGNGHSESVFLPYMESLLSELAEELWVIGGDGEIPVLPADDAQPYLNKKVLYIKNHF